MYGTRPLKGFSPLSHTSVKCRWVFKIKHNDVYWAILVACECTQVPGVDFSKTYSPVVSDIIFRMILLIMIKFGFLAKVVNVKTALLYKELEEEIFAEHHPEMKNIHRDDCIILKNFIYGLVHEARQYNEKAIEI